jgi:hypothetical protein
MNTKTIDEAYSEYQDRHSVQLDRVEFIYEDKGKKKPKLLVKFLSQEYGENTLDLSPYLPDSYVPMIYDARTDTMIEDPDFPLYSWESYIKVAVLPVLHQRATSALREIIEVNRDV